MTTHGTVSRSGISPLLVGAVIGAVAGFLVDLFWLRGLAVLVAIAVVSAFVRPRFAMLGAVLLGAGGLWLPFTTGNVVICVANPSSCSGPSPVPFAIVAAAVLIVGVLTLEWSRRHVGRARDIRAH
jgi:uncharacterized membrane protein YoaK (UPF0700 family)